MTSLATSASWPSRVRGQVGREAMHVHGGEQRRPGVRAARQERPHHAREHVAHAPGGHPRIARGIQEHPAVRIADHARRPLQDEMNAVRRREAAHALDAVALDVGHRHPEHARHLARVGRETARAAGAAQDLEMAGEGGERVGVDDHGPRDALDQLPRRLLRVRLEAEARPQGHGVARLREGLHRRHGAERDGSRGDLGQRLGHALEEEPGHDRLLAGGRPHRDEPRARAHGRARGQRRRARLARATRRRPAGGHRCPCAPRAAGRERAAPRRRARRETSRCPAPPRPSGIPMGTTCTRPASAAPGPGDQAALQAGEGRGQRGADGRARRRPRRRPTRPRECRARPPDAPRR